MQRVSKKIERENRCIRSCHSIQESMNHPRMISHLCLTCGFGFLVMECDNFIEEKDECEGCNDTHCCRECGSRDTRPKTKEEKQTIVKRVDRSLFQCGDCGLQFTQLECASHTNKYVPEENRWPTCMEDCECNVGAKNSIHRCPTCLTLNAHYAGLKQ